MALRTKLLVQSFAKSILSYIIAKFQDSRDWSLRNWKRYILYKNVFLVISLPLWFLLIYVTKGNLAVYFVPPILLLLELALYLFIDGKRTTIAEGDPEAFVAGERTEHLFHIAGNIMSISTLVFMYSLTAYTLILRINPQTKDVTLSISWLYVFIALIFAMFSALTPLVLKSFEATLKINFIRRPTIHALIPEYFPSEPIRASARFTLALQSLPSSPSPNPRKSILRKFAILKEGINIYNDYLTDRFRITINNVDRFYKQAKLRAFFTDEVDNVKSGIESLIGLMHNSEEQPFEFIKTLKMMICEPTCQNELCKEVEIDTHLVKRWFTRHNDLTKDVIVPLCIALIPIAISIILGLHG